LRNTFKILKKTKTKKNQVNNTKALRISRYDSSEIFEMSGGRRGRIRLSSSDDRDFKTSEDSSRRLLINWGSFANLKDTAQGSVISISRHSGSASSNSNFRLSILELIRGTVWKLLLEPRHLRALRPISRRWVSHYIFRTLISYTHVAVRSQSEKNREQRREGRSETHWF
jgi:hypothetical protein